MVEPAKLGKIIAELASKFPAGVLLWHRSSGKRGLVVGYKITSDGSARLVMDTGPGDSYDESLPLAWSSVKIDPDADEWQQPEPKT